MHLTNITRLTLGFVLAASSTTNIDAQTLLKAPPFIVSASVVRSPSIIPGPVLFDVRITNVTNITIAAQYVQSHIELNAGTQKLSALPCVSGSRIDLVTDSSAVAAAMNDAPFVRSSYPEGVNPNLNTYGALDVHDQTIVVQPLSTIEIFSASDFNCDYALSPGHFTVDVISEFLIDGATEPFDVRSLPIQIVLSNSMPLKR